MVRLPAGAVDRVAIFAGFGLMVGGVWQWSPPGAMVLAGALLLVAALWRTP
jgi:hypothetical protein